MGERRKVIRERDISGLKYLDLLLPMLGRLHEVGCQRDKAGNRKLHYDEYCLLVLLFLFNPVVGSLRGLQQASQLKNVQRKLGCSRASLGSLSEATQVFDQAIISCWLISLWTGGKPTLRTYEMLCYYLMGWADLDELTAHIQKLQPTR